MGLDDLVGKVKGALSGNEDKAKGALDQAGEFVKQKTPDNIDPTVDEVVGKAKEFIDDQKA